MTRWSKNLSLVTVIRNHVLPQRRSVWVSVDLHWVFVCVSVCASVCVFVCVCVCVCPCVWGGVWVCVGPYLTVIRYSRMTWETGEAQCPPVHYEMLSLRYERFCKQWDCVNGALSVLTKLSKTQEYGTARQETQISLFAIYKNRRMITIFSVLNSLVFSVFTRFPVF